MAEVSAELRTSPVVQRSPGTKMASPFVGRDEELRNLTSALDLAAKGCGNVVFLTGEPGIGKTRLAREALLMAKGRGFMILEGRAYPMGPGLAYIPVVDAFAPALRALSPGRLAALTDGLSSLGRLFEDLHLPSPEPLNDPALEKTRLFEAVSCLLDRLAQEMPVALFIDDLHRCDPASLDLLHYLARGLPNRRALFLTTYSDLEPTRNLRAMVSSLVRDGVAEELRIISLDKDTVHELT